MTMKLAGVEWQVDESGTLFRVTASGEGQMSVEQSHRCLVPTRYWGVIETCNDARLMATRAQHVETDDYASQEEAAVAVVALARKRAVELLELAGESTTPEPQP